MVINVSLPWKVKKTGQMGIGLAHKGFRTIIYTSLDTLLLYNLYYNLFFTPQINERTASSTKIRHKKLRP